MERSECKRLNDLIKRLQKIYPGLKYNDCLQIRQKLFEAFTEASEQGKYYGITVNNKFYNAISQGYHLNLDQDHLKANGKITD